jgi:peptidoglycan/xylan/chitin deacetylase (PgdA/CDA1 family)
VGQWVHWDGYAPMKIMDCAEIQALAAEGVDFQAHTVTHPDLTACAPAAVAEELTRGAALIEHITGRPVEFFAYPHGRCNKEVRDAVLRAGYLAAFTCRIARNTLSDDPLLLNRVFLSNRPEWWRLHRELTR